MEGVIERTSSSEVSLLLRSHVACVSKPSQNQNTDALIVGFDHEGSVRTLFRSVNRSQRSTKARSKEQWLRKWHVGDWECAAGTSLADAVKYTVMINVAPIFLKSSFVAMVLFFPKLWSILHRVSWKWNKTLFHRFLGIARTTESKQQ